MMFKLYQHEKIPYIQHFQGFMETEENATLHKLTFYLQKGNLFFHPTS